MRQTPILDKTTKDKVNEFYYSPRARKKNHTQYSIQDSINLCTNKPHTIEHNNLQPNQRTIPLNEC